LLNYLLLLGWSLDDKTEEFTREEMIGHFSLERVNRSPASFDPQKLIAFQSRHMMTLPVAERTARCLPFLEAAGLLPHPVAEKGVARARKIVQAAGDRLVVAGDILEYDDFFVADTAIEYDETAFDKRLRKPEDAAGLLGEFRSELAATPEFTAAALDERMRAFCESRGLKLGAIVHTVRVAVTGKAVGFGIFETLEILGRESCLVRIDRALERVHD
jgi:glutamyl-tRNA synthetase